MNEQKELFRANLSISCLAPKQENITLGISLTIPNIFSGFNFRLKEIDLLWETIELIYLFNRSWREGRWSRDFFQACGMAFGYYPHRARANNKNQL